MFFRVCPISSRVMTMSPLILQTISSITVTSAAYSANETNIPRASDPEKIARYRISTL